MGKSSPPPAPDYSGAATATAQGNLEATRAATAANRVNQYTPYGNLIYSHTEGGGPDDWQSQINLSPTGQALLSQQDQTSLGLSNLQNQATSRVAGSLNQPFDYSSVGDVQNAAEKAITSRLDPQWQQRQGQMENQLANQGITRGSEAYDNASREFGQQRNDAYQQAVMAGINTMPQTYQMAQALRSQPLNELNAIRTGSQVNNPTFQNAPQQQTTSGPDFSSAAANQYGGSLNAYNAQQGSTNNLLKTAGEAGLMALMFSDRRLKSNVMRLGTYKGYPWYRFTIFGRPAEGVMADEVPDSAKILHNSGYWMVNYGRL
jgi:hypothetical protein